jgi:transposase
MARYPAMVRRRIIELYNQDYSTSEIAEVFGVCASGVRRVRQRLRERGTLQPLPRTCGRKTMLSSQLQRQIQEHIADRPDATREEIRSALGLNVSLQSLSKWFKRLGLVLKKSRCTPQSRTGPMLPSDAPFGTSSSRPLIQRDSCSSMSPDPRPA